MRVVCGTGHGGDEDDDEKRSKLPSVVVALTPTKIATILNEATVQETEKSNQFSEEDSWQSKKSEFCNKKVTAATTAATALIALQESAAATTAPHSNRCIALIPRRNFVRGCLVEKVDDAVQSDVKARMHIYTVEWETNYDQWRRELQKADKAPYAEQWVVLDAVHEQCRLEQCYERSQSHGNGQLSSAIFKLIHGLPGSGKTQLMLWIRSYFEEVWNWEAGTHFVFLAPLNTMAANISGATLHAFGADFCAYPG